MSTIEDVRGILIAGETPEVNGVQIHQDKLGEYIRTGGTMNGRPAYFKDNNTNHMLWFAPASDGPTWYVGKREEFGQPRGWLQVKSDAPTPAEITGAWGVWVAAEKLWKEGREVQCVAVSATPGVYIHGPTPNQLLQDKLGEYRRVQQRVVTERGVYEMVGMQNVMMWYAPGGTWNIGKRDELGQNRGWYQAVSKAISPEGITNWQVWDGANRKWEKALELQAMSVGSKRVAFTGNTPRGINARASSAGGVQPSWSVPRARKPCPLAGGQAWRVCAARIPVREWARGVRGGRDVGAVDVVLQQVLVHRPVAGRRQAAGLALLQGRLLLPGAVQGDVARL
mmetsp:Transcript_23296/g.78644  ORF Transcript_23296/g.78644 Transcript_23296/m.78644 type:complete len:339 (-) Transcript_23296:2306-3322(-)